MRKFLLTLGGLFALLLIAGGVAYNLPAVQDALFERAATALMSSQPDSPEGLRVVVCGSASPLGNDPDRAQACIAVQTPEHFFLFDVGARSPMRIGQARLPLSQLNGVFLTHFHSDHIAALPDVNLASWVRGRRESLKVYGPPGVETVVEGFNRAYELDRSYRIAHHGTELLPPAAGPMTAVPIQPGGIAWQDGQMTVRSFVVNHDPVRPAVGYRVDYGGRSVVISGDTVAVDTLFDAAEGADLVLHDALARSMLDPMIETGRKLNLPVMPQIMTDVIDYHADSLALEARARAAGIRQLAYYHLVPVPANDLAERIFRRGLSEDTILVRDLHTFDLPTGSGEIHIRAP